MLSEVVCMSGVSERTSGMTWMSECDDWEHKMCDEMTCV